MKKLIIKLFRLYQNIPGNFHNGCRYIPSCSEYGIIAVNRFGTIKGLYLTFNRILRCGFHRGKGIDLVRERKKL